ncbi:hypothetical protein BCF46_1339 [Litoreibacter meonggei]|uniref:Uncharacterized protein n=1 Tax=Litoreibacter meonggei TaxID=1049199 RepID=A0A497X3J4_9RHOB|nr:hypothetical protein [Litoreibacter meonggei]RLJ59193.1 hypothetical protein BCF46_1339 [Litoreibacter meonggei]
MSDRTSHKDTPKPQHHAQIREARLKAALKANMGRRKQQARARKTPGNTGDNETKGQ